MFSVIFKIILLILLDNCFLSIPNIFIVVFSPSLDVGYFQTTDKLSISYITKHNIILQYIKKYFIFYKCFNYHMHMIISTLTFISCTICIDNIIGFPFYNTDRQIWQIWCKFRSYFMIWHLTFPTLPTYLALILFSRGFSLIMPLGSSATWSHWTNIIWCS